MEITQELIDASYKRILTLYMHGKTPAEIINDQQAVFALNCCNFARQVLSWAMNDDELKGALEKSSAKLDALLNEVASSETCLFYQTSPHQRYYLQRLRGLFYVNLADAEEGE